MTIQKLSCSGSALARRYLLAIAYESLCHFQEGCFEQSNADSVKLLKNLIHTRQRIKFRILKKQVEEITYQHQTLAGI